MIHAKLDHLHSTTMQLYSYNSTINNTVNNEPGSILQNNISTGASIGTTAVHQQAELENQLIQQDIEEFEQKHEAFVHPKYDNYTIIKASINCTDLNEEIGIITNKDGSVTIVRSDENKNKTFINVADKNEAYKLINALEHFDEPDAEKILKKMSKQYNKGEPFYNIGTKGDGMSVRNINLIQH